MIRAIPEILKNGVTGTMVASEDIEELTEAIIYALENKSEIQNRAKAARKLIKKEFSWDVSVKKFIEVYKSLL